MKVVLVFPPFVLYNMPSFALSSLNGALKEHGIDSEVVYANLIFKKYLMSPIYENFSQSHSFFWLLGDYIFASRAFPEAGEKHKLLEERFGAILDNDKIVSKSLNSYSISFDTVAVIKKQVDPFLEEITDMILAKNPDIVGFGALFQQTVASIAIAKRLKEKNPAVTTIMGGANCLAPMGPEFAKIAPDIDYVFMGEAEEELPAFCRNSMEGKKPENKCITCRPVADINKLPLPDYSDFFAQLETMGFINKNKPAFPYNHIYMETNRGCNLSVYKQCAYCGFYYPAFREKSLDRVFSEIQQITSLYNVRSLTIADNVMSDKIVRKVFSRLEDKFIDTLNYSGRIDSTSYSDLALLADKCKTVVSFAGVETLHDDLLESLNKQTNTVGNLRFLRDCRSLGIKVCWFYLNTVPGETREHYEQMMELIPLIHHLESPSYVLPVIPVRYSHYFDEPQKYGISNITPPDSFNYIFPDEADVKNIPVFFDSHTYSPLDEPSFRERFFGVVQKWIDVFDSAEQKPVLEIKNEEDGLFLYDTRSISTGGKRKVDHGCAELLTFLKKPRTAGETEEYVKKEDLGPSYAKLLEWNCLAAVHGSVVSLVTGNTP